MNKKEREPLKEIELLEKKYFDIIADVIKNNQNYIINNFRIVDKVKKSWISFAHEKKTNLFDESAERVFRWIIINKLKWEYLPVPISSDECFLLGDAIIHIDSKTLIVTDRYDVFNSIKINENYPEINYKHLTVARNQSNFPHKDGICKGKKVKWNPRLPNFYEINDKRKYCLTYFIRMVYSIICPRCGEIQDVGPEGQKKAKNCLKTEVENFICAPYGNIRYLKNNSCKFIYRFPTYRLEEIVLYCMPNGELKRYYGDDLLGKPCYKSPITEEKEVVGIGTARFLIDKIKSPEITPEWWGERKRWTREEKLITKPTELINGIS